MRRKLPFRLSTRPGRQFLNFILRRQLKKSLGKEVGVDVGCGEMVNYDLFLTKRYVGIDIDQSRLNAGARAHQGAEFLCASIFEPPLVSGDFVLCVQVFNNKHFDPSKALLAVENLCGMVQKNGDLVFNIGMMSLTYEADIDRLLLARFSSVRKIRYDSKLFAGPKPIFVSLIIGAISLLFPPVRIMGGYSKVLYCASNATGGIDMQLTDAPGVRK